ncbi:hypothetical protein DCC27_007385 [Auritidibacter sp. NML130574]|uniref:hypothetical protein n=1 Tax=Auritidibacter sp. NML130574 TaxID=2170745 RepID=UPI000D72DA7A|nr:hypothetical protein [Auritidibacter sp. NML130574]AXR74144.1 hypothetical protein DCC27_007385 [Auritidibacter sp. NML130574]
MEYLIPVLIILGVAVLVALGYRGVAAVAKKNNGSSKPSRSSSGTGGGSQRRGGGLSERISPITAAQASTRLDEEDHRQVYRLIAVGKMREAAMRYREATGVSSMDAMLDVQALASYPQEWISIDEAVSSSEPDTPHMARDSVENTPLNDRDDQRDQDDLTPTDRSVPDDSDGATSADQAGSEQSPATEDGEQELTNLTVPVEWENEDFSTPEPRGFQVEVMRDNGTVQLSSEDLPPWLRDQLRAMVRDHRIDEAAQTLSEHTMLTVPEAMDLMQILSQQDNNPQDDA